MTYSTLDGQKIDSTPDVPLGAPKVGAAQSMVRSGVSSIIATVVDAIVYQAMLFVWIGHYGVAAAVAAVAGAITNFAINRQWSFVATGHNVVGQAIRYTVVSGLTFACLRFLLWLFIEVIGIGVRIAWIPSKILAFVVISFPMQRFWVFRIKSR